MSIVWTDEISRSDIVLIRKAIARGWRVPTETRTWITKSIFHNSLPSWSVIDSGSIPTSANFFERFCAVP